MKIRNILLTIILLFTTKAVFADCAWSGMQFFPQQKNISLRPMFIIQGYGESQKTIETFKTRKVFLENEKGEMVVLTLVEILKGQMGLTQAIFKPSEKLKPNTIYFLKYADITKPEQAEMYQWNRKSEQREKVYWQTSNIEMIAELNPDHRLVFEKNEVVQYGCGPSANAIFKMVNNTETETWYKTEVIEITTKQKTIFYISAWEKKLNVGHGMCSGAFTFKNTGKYQVRFTPMNTDGKELKTTDWAIFESPYMNDKW